MLLFFGVAEAQEPIPQGEEFQVNTYTTSDQRMPSVAVDSQGNCVVVWRSDGSYASDTDSNSVQGQRFDAVGNPLGNQFQVNTYTTRSQTWPVVAVEVNGNFAVVWQSAGSNGSDSYSNSVQGQRYDAAGNALGDQFQVNTYTTAWQQLPSVAEHPDGDFVVVWESMGSSGSDTGYTSIQGQRYDAAGNRLGSEFQVNSYTTGIQVWPAVAVGADQDFVVIWQSDGSSGSDNDSGSIQAQRYDAAGNRLGSEFQVNSYTTGMQRDPSVALDSGGAFVVVWTSDGSYETDSHGWSIQGQRFDEAGNPVGDQFQVNTYTTGLQQSSFVGVGGDGDFVVVWKGEGSYGTDTDYTSIQGQRFADPTVFADGFESGDTSAWSKAVP